MDSKKLKGDESKRLKTLDDFFGSKKEPSETAIKKCGQETDDEKAAVSEDSSQSSHKEDGMLFFMLILEN